MRYNTAIIGPSLVNTIVGDAGKVEPKVNERFVLSLTKADLADPVEATSLWESALPLPPRAYLLAASWASWA
jgi:hypothetical protein